VLRTIYLMFSAGHRAATGDQIVRPDLCSQAVRLARDVSSRFPGDTEARGLLALILLTDARRAARSDANGDLVLLEEQDRTLWDRAMIDEGEALLTDALAAGRPGPFQIWAAIAACHSIAPTASHTDWRQISLLYSELLGYEASPVVEANRAIAVAMAEGPAAGLTILDVIVKDPQLSTWPAIHIARADLLARAGRHQPAIDAYRTALELEPTSPERAFIARRIAALEELRS
jgi:RNA polymerase sigma-70 factor (ECF subfamily)